MNDTPDPSTQDLLLARRIRNERTRLSANFRNMIGAGLISVGCWGVLFSIPLLTQERETWRNAAKLAVSLVSAGIGVAFHRAGVRRLNQLVLEEPPAAAAMPPAGNGSDRG